MSSTEYNPPALVAGNVKTGMKKAAAVSADLWKVPPKNIRVLPGFNVRVRDQAYEDKVLEIRDSILANGFYIHMPLKGYVAMEGGEEVIYLTGGHRRFEAAELAIANGAAIETLPVVVSPRGTSMEDLTVELLRDNEGDKCTTYEYAVGCARLSRSGWDSATIQKHLGLSSVQYVDKLLSLAAAPMAIRQMVISGAVSATLAIDALEKHKEKAVDVLVATLAKAGGARVTPKAMPGAAVDKAVKKYAAPMYDTLKSIKADPGVQFLSPALRELLDKLLADVVGKPKGKKVAK